MVLPSHVYNVVFVEAVVEQRDCAVLLASRAPAAAVSIRPIVS